MAAPRISLSFTDGRVEEVTVNPRCLVEVERKYGQTIPAIEGTLYGAWIRLGRPDTFDEWLDTVDNFDGATTAADPSLPAPSAGS